MAIIMKFIEQCKTKKEQIENEEVNDLNTIAGSFAI
jgi:hypothetical protein